MSVESLGACLPPEFCECVVSTIKQGGSKCLLVTVHPHTKVPFSQSIRSQIPFLGRVSIHFLSSISVLMIFQGISHSHRWHHHIFHDATFSHPDENLVQTQWMVYRAGRSHRNYTYSEGRPHQSTHFFLLWRIAF